MAVQVILGIASITYAVPPVNSARIFRVGRITYPYTTMTDNRIFYVFKPKILRS